MGVEYWFDFVYVSVRFGFRRTVIKNCLFSVRKKFIFAFFGSVVFGFLRFLVYVGLISLAVDGELRVSVFAYCIVV